MSFPSRLALAACCSLLGLVSGCDSSVVGGGAGGAEGTGGGDVGSGGDTTGSSTTAAETTGAGDPTGPSSTSSAATGGSVPGGQGVIVPRDDTEAWLLLANAPQSCAAPLSEPACQPGDSWLAYIDIPLSDLRPGTYELGTAEIGISVMESFDDCTGGGGRGWSGEPASLVIESIDANHAVITIEGAYDDVDGTWDVPLCGVSPA